MAQKTDINTKPTNYKMTKFFSNECPIHHCKLGETAMGVKWCPKCEGTRMAKEVSKKLKLNLKV